MGYSGSRQIKGVSVCLDVRNGTRSQKRWEEMESDQVVG